MDLTDSIFLQSYIFFNGRISELMLKMLHKLRFNVWRHFLQDARGNDVDFSTYKGKVLLIVNVASKW